MVIEAHVVLCLTAGFFKNNIFASKMDQKCGFWNLSENLDINFFVIYIIHCILAQILYLVEI